MKLHLPSHVNMKHPITVVGPRPGGPRGFGPGSFQGMAGSLPAQSGPPAGVGSQSEASQGKTVPQRPLGPGKFPMLAQL